MKLDLKSYEEKKLNTFFIQLRQFLAIPDNTLQYIVISDNTFTILPNTLNTYKVLTVPDKPCISWYHLVSTQHQVFLPK